MREVRRGAILVLFAGVVLRGQQPSPDAVFRTTTRLVQVSIIAQDKQGKPVPDLRREEFQILDNGSPQEIQLFVAEMQKSDPAPPEVKLPPDTYTNQFAPAPASAHSGYSIILFDNLVSGFGDPLTGEEGTGYGVQRVLRVVQSLPPGERIAIYALGRRLHVVREFTADRDSLEQHLRSWKPSSDDAITGTALCPGADSASDLAGRAISDAGPHTNEAAVACVSGDVAIRVAAMKEELKQIADHVAGIPGRKNMIWMANRFPVGGGESIQKLMDAGVAIYPVDENGVLAPSPSQGAMQILARMTGGVATPSGTTSILQCMRPLRMAVPATRWASTT